MSDETARIKAEADYLRGMKYKDIAQKYGVTLNTVKSWKTRYKWDRKSVHPKEKSVHTKGGAPLGNKNAAGNRGGTGGPAANDKAVKHGFFQKYFPAETVEIMKQIEVISPIDILWDNIVIQYTAIVRAQQIMFVKDQSDETKVLKKVMDMETGGMNEWEYQHAWDKQANFLQAQSRAMATLQSMIVKYEDLCRQGMADEEQQLRIEKLKAEVKAIGKTGDEGDRGGLDQLAMMIEKSAAAIRGDD